jgi:plastocyanin
LRAIVRADLFMTKQYPKFFVMFLSFLAINSCFALDLHVQVLTADNKPLSDAVVYIESTAEHTSPATKMAVMDQQNKAFVPHVLAVPVGTTVNFPNTDSVNHYVYSFSEIKKFQFKLFKGDLEAHQTLLDKPGLVTIGCNIHDFMLGYIFVAPTAYVGVSNSAGRVDLKLPDKGELSLAIWHERNNENLEKLSQKIDLGSGTQNIQLKFTKALKPQRKMSHEGDDY